MPVLSNVRHSLAMAMRARGLPTPSTALKATLGWSAVAAYALLYQISVRRMQAARGLHQSERAHCPRPKAVGVESRRRLWDCKVEANAVLLGWPGHRWGCSAYSRMLPATATFRDSMPSV